MSDFKPGDAVKINRPNKAGHGQTGRYVEPGADPHFAWVAFHSDKRKVPTLGDYLKQSTCPRKLFPLSQLTKLDQ